MIYLLHSTVPLGTSGSNAASHYLGFCEEDDLLRRLKEHNSGKSDAAIVRAFKAAGADLHLVAVWPGRTRTQERQMKTAGHLSRYCHICNSGTPRRLK
jgi:predicted GIY-YIG superfamily endonuclease